MKNEIWKKIEGYDELYEVSSFGRFKSKKGITKGHLNGFDKLIVCMRKDGKLKAFNVHQLVAEAFLGHSIFNFNFTVNHKNKDKSDNRLENLELVSQVELAKTKNMNK